MRELSQEEYSKIKPLIRETSYGLNNHSIFKTFKDAVNSEKPISLNGSPYKGRKNRGKSHIKDIVRLPDGRFALLSKQLCIDAGIQYFPGNMIANVSERFEKIDYNLNKKNSKSQVSSNDDKFKMENLEKKEAKYCTICGNEINPSTKFCDECGTKIGKLTSSVNFNDNVIQRSQIGAASVGNVNIQPNIPIIIPEINNNNIRSLWFGLILIVIILSLIFLLK